MTGGLMAQTPLTLLIEHFDWRTAIILDALLGCIIFVAIIFFVKDRPVIAIDAANDQHLLKEGQNAVIKEMGILKSMKTAYFKCSKVKFICLYGAIINGYNIIYQFS